MSVERILLGNPAELSVSQNSAALLQCPPFLELIGPVFACACRQPCWRAIDGRPQPSARRSHSSSVGLIPLGASPVFCSLRP